MMYLLLIIMFLLVFIIGYYYVSFIKSLFFTKVPYIGSFNRQLNLLKSLKLDKGKTIVDLGCGDGKALRFFEKQFLIKGTGYDINSFAILYGKIINKIKKNNILLIKDNFIGRKINKFDYIYIYLFPKYMEEIEERIFLTKNKKTIIMSNSFKFKKHSPYKIIGKKIYLYKD